MTIKTALNMVQMICSVTIVELCGMYEEIDVVYKNLSEEDKLPIRLWSGIARGKNK